MDRETIIDQGLHITDDGVEYDAACKRVLSERTILARIMKACFEEFRDSDVNDITEKYIEGQPQVSNVPIQPDENSFIINGMDTGDKSIWPSPSMAESLSILITRNSRKLYSL